MIFVWFQSHGRNDSSVVIAGFEPGAPRMRNLVPEVFLERRKRVAKRREREKSLLTLDVNLTFIQTPGSGSDPQARIGWYSYKHANQYDWFVWLVIPRKRVIAKLPLVPFEIINLTRFTDCVCMKVRFESKVTRAFSLSSGSRKTSGTRLPNANPIIGLPSVDYCDPFVSCNCLSAQRILAAWMIIPRKRMWLKPGRWTHPDDCMTRTSNASLLTDRVLDSVEGTSFLK